MSSLSWIDETNRCELILSPIDGRHPVSGSPLRLPLPRIYPSKRTEYLLWHRSKTRLYPTESDEWLKTILIGGVLTVFGFLLVPMLPVYGYIVRTLQYRLEGQPEPPSFEEWGTLVVDGLQAWIVGLVYLVIPLIVAGVTVGGSIAAMATGSRAGSAAGVAGLIGGLTITFILMLVFGYFAVVAVVNFARENRFGAAFDLDTIRAVALDRDYAIPWGISVLVFIVAGIVGSVLNIIPFLGFVVGSFVFFYAQIVAAFLWADGFTAALGTQPETENADIGEPMAEWYVIPRVDVFIRIQIVRYSRHVRSHRVPA